MMPWFLIWIKWSIFIFLLWMSLGAIGENQRIIISNQVVIEQRIIELLEILGAPEEYPQ